MVIEAAAQKHHGAFSNISLCESGLKVLCSLMSDGYFSLTLQDLHRGLVGHLCKHLSNAVVVWMEDIQLPSDLQSHHLTCRWELYGLSSKLFCRRKIHFLSL